jgi:hypothetical protein
MKKWEIFENNAAEYISKVCKESNLGVTVTQGGGANSNEADIIIKKDGSVVFTIESKLSPSQGGQFVIVNSGSFYTFSTGNKLDCSYQSAQDIISYLNTNYSKFNNVVQSAINIECLSGTLISWVINHYKAKESKFVITSTKPDGNMILIPIDSLGIYFDITACLRRKKSGSAHLPRMDFQRAEGELKVYLRRIGNGIREFKMEGNKAVVTLNKSVDLAKGQCYLGTDLFLSKQSSTKYCIKKRSSTNNETVVFSLRYTGEDKEQGKELLVQEIRNRLTEMEQVGRI